MYLNVTSLKHKSTIAKIETATLVGSLTYVCVRVLLFCKEIVFGVLFSLVSVCCRRRIVDGHFNATTEFIE